MKDYLKKNFVPLLIIYGLTLLIFYQVKNFDFLSNWDDDNYIIRNPDIAQISWENIKKIFTSFYISNYQPLTMLVYMLELAVFGLKPAAFHWLNVLFHVVNIFLVYRITDKLFGGKYTPFIVAVLFAIHPTRLESVTWIAELKDVMYACFYLASINSFINFISTNKNKYLYISLLWFLASLLSKSMAITLPAILLLIYFYQKQKLDKNILIKSVPFFILSVIFGLLALYTQSQKAMEIAMKTGVVDRIFLVFYAIWLYIEKLILPVNLAGIHYYPPKLDGSFPLKVYLSPVLVFIIGFLLWKIKRYRTLIIFGVLFFLISISIVIQIVPFGYAIIAERYTYIPYLGFFFIIGVVVNEILEGKSFIKYKSIVKYAGIIALILLTYQSYSRNKVWLNSVIFFGDIAKKYPYSDHIHWIYGNSLKDYKMYRKAIASYNKAIEINPDYAMAYFNRGVAKAQLKNYQDAIKDYQKTIELDSSYYPAYNNMANAFLSLKEYETALQYINKAMEINPEYHNAKLTKADLLTLMKKYEEALPWYNEFLKIFPNNSKALYNRAVCLYYLKQHNKACADWKKAAKLGNKSALKSVQQYCR